jgi:hypothetical protein
MFANTVVNLNVHYVLYLRILSIVCRNCKILSILRFSLKSHLLFYICIIILVKNFLVSSVIQHSDLTKNKGRYWLDIIGYGHHLYMVLYLPKSWGVIWMSCVLEVLICCLLIILYYHVIVLYIQKHCLMSFLFLTV